jgi:hypothetical protein
MDLIRQQIRHSTSERIHSNPSRPKHKITRHRNLLWDLLYLPILIFLFRRYSINDLVFPDFFDSSVDNDLDAVSFEASFRVFGNILRVRVEDVISGLYDIDLDLSAAYFGELSKNRINVRIIPEGERRT